MNMKFNNYHPMVALKRILKKRITGCVGGALFLSPIYFYGVDRFQFKVIYNWVNLQNNYVWGIAALPLSIFGIYILIINLSSKKNYGSLLYRFSLLLAAVMLIFSTWIYTDQYIAYFGIIAFVIGTTILFDSIIDLGYKLTEIYNKLEPFEKLTICITVITILLNAILR